MDEAMNIFKQMQMDGVQPNVVAYTTLLDGLSLQDWESDYRNGEMPYQRRVVW